MSAGRGRIGLGRDNLFAGALEPCVHGILGMKPDTSDTDKLEELMLLERQELYNGNMATTVIHNDRLHGDIEFKIQEDKTRYRNTIYRRHSS